MSLRTWVFRLFHDGPDVVECKRCGTTVSTGADRCPECGHGEFVRYEIPT